MPTEFSGYWPAFSSVSAADQVQDRPLVYDIYMTEPLESNRRRYPCLSLSIMENGDLSNYLIVVHGHDPANYIPLNDLAGYKLWVKKAPPEATLSYFDLYDEKKVNQLHRDKFLLTRNTRTRDWDEALLVQENVDYINSLTQQQLEHYAQQLDMPVEEYASKMKRTFKFRVKDSHGNISAS